MLHTRTEGAELMGAFLANALEGTLGDSPVENQGTAGPHTDHTQIRDLFL